MRRPPFGMALPAAMVTVLLCVAGPARAQEPATPPLPPPAAIGSAAPLIARLAAEPRTPDGYAATLELHVKLHSFPFIGLTVHGNSTFRRPGLYHFELHNLPHVAANFDDLHYDLGDPSKWAVKYDIALAPQSTEEVPVLRLTPKHPGTVIGLDIQSDAKYGHILKATWLRKDGGTIVLTQTYSAFGTADVVTEQHATIDIPHMRAELTANYTNITIETPTFAGVPER